MLGWRDHVSAIPISGIQMNRVSSINMFILFYLNSLLLVESKSWNSVLYLQVGTIARIDPLQERQ